MNMVQTVTNNVGITSKQLSAANTCVTIDTTGLSLANAVRTSPTTATGAIVGTEIDTCSTNYVLQSDLDSSPKTVSCITATAAAALEATCDDTISGCTQ